MVREVFSEATSCPYDHLRSPHALLKPLIAPSRAHALWRLLRRLIIDWFGGQDYSVVARKR